MKKTAIILSVSFLVVLLSVTVSAEEKNGLVFAEKSYSSSGAEFSVPVEIKNNPGVMGFSVILTYDADEFQPVSVTKGTLLSGLFNDSIATSSPGEFKVVFSGTSDFIEDGVLFTVNFKTLSSENTISQIGVNYSQVDTFNENWEDVKLDCKDIIVQLGEDNSKELYKMQWYSRGELYAAEYIYEGDRIIPPAEPEWDGHNFVGWSQFPEYMPSTDCSAEAYFDMTTGLDVSINRSDYLENKKIDYKSTIIFQAVTGRSLYNNEKIEWFIDEKKVADGKTFTLEKVDSDFTVFCCVVSESGETSESEHLSVKVNNNLFAKIIAFFREWFAKLPTVDLTKGRVE